MIMDTNELIVTNKQGTRHQTLCWLICILFHSILTSNLWGRCWHILCYKEGNWSSGKKVQFSAVTQSFPTPCDLMDCSTPSLPVHHQLPESTQTHVHWVGDAIQPSHPLSSPSLPAFNLSQHQDLFKWISSLHQVAKVLEFQLQHQSFQWTPRTDLL